MSDLQIFSDRAALTIAMADLVVATLQDAIAERGTGHIALAGGSTPKPIYEALSTDDRVPWDKVTAMLTDERLTPPGDPASNEAMLHAALIQGFASTVRYQQLEENTPSLPQQDLILLGMGADGHFASLFPGAEELSEGLSPDAPAVLRMTPNPLPANAPFPRLSLSLPTILNAHRLVVVITGDEKRSVFEQAHEPGAIEDLPIRALLQSGHADFQVAWAP